MKKALTALSVILLFMALGLSLAGESQKGGLPALEDRVEKLEHQMAALISKVGSLQHDVATLKSVVSSLQHDVATLKSLVSSFTNSVLNLKGQNNWAVVDSSATVVRHSGASNVTASRWERGRTKSRSRTRT